MKKYIEIRIDGVCRLYSLNFSEKYPNERIEIDNVCIIYLHKFHDHNYLIKAFFYKTKYIFYAEHIKTKKELFVLIKKLIEENT